MKLLNSLTFRYIYHVLKQDFNFYMLQVNLTSKKSIQ